MEREPGCGGGKVPGGDVEGINKDILPIEKILDGCARLKFENGSFFVTQPTQHCG